VPQIGVDAFHIVRVALVAGKNHVQVLLSL
jgi:hypothetical protein